MNILPSHLIGELAAAESLSKKLDDKDATKITAMLWTIWGNFDLRGRVNSNRMSKFRNMVSYLKFKYQEELRKQIQEQGEYE